MLHRSSHRGGQDTWLSQTNICYLFVLTGLLSGYISLSNAFQIILQDSLLTRVSASELYIACWSVLIIAMLVDIEETLHSVVMYNRFV